MTQERWFDSWTTTLAALFLPVILYKAARSIILNFQKEKFHKKVVVITGASSGIGEYLSYELYKRGCKLVLCARREDQLQRVESNILKLESNIQTFPPIIVPLDVSDVQSLQGHVNDIIAKVGRIDILINNAGISNRGSVKETILDVYKQVMNVNYFGTVALTKAVLPHMIKRKRGRIVMISSVQGFIGIPDRSAYAASKHALQAFSDSLRTEVHQYGIEVTVVNPGYVQSELSLNALTGSGEMHNQKDANTENGFPPDYTAKEIANAIAQGKKEFIISQWLPRIAVFLRHNFPNVYFFIMLQRYKHNKE